MRRAAVWLGLLGLGLGSAQAELLGTHPQRNGPVQLMSELCLEPGAGAGQQARQTVGGRERHGCWGVDRAGHPVVTWRDGSELVLAPAAEALALAAEPDFARPGWCPQASFPHERLVCSDAELAGRDLRLAALWRPFRRTLDPQAQAWHKSDYFRRLRACGADKSCITGEQETQMSRYREARRDGG